MTRILSSTLAVWLGAVIWLGTAATLMAQTNPLEAISDDALGFAVIKNLDDTNERLGKLTAKMQLPVPDVMSMVKGMLGIEEGIDSKGSLAFVMIGGPEGEEWTASSLVALVPVTDYKAFIKPLQPQDADATVTEVTVAGSEMLVGKKGNFAVFALDTDFKDELEKFLKATTNVTATVEPLKGWLANQQAAIVVTPKGKKVLLKMIVEALPDAKQLEDAEAAEEAPGGADAFKSVGEMMGMAKQVLAQADSQVSQAAIGVRIDDSTALHVSIRAPFVPGEKLAAWSKDIKVPEKGLLAGLPGGKFALVYGGVSAQMSPEVAASLARFGDLSMQMIGMDEAGRKKLNEINARLSANRQSINGVMGMMRPGDTLISTAVSVERVKSAAEHIKDTRAMFELMKGTLKNTEADQPLYDVSEVKVGELTALELVTDMSSLPNLNGDKPGADQMRSMFNKLYGGEGKMRMYVTAANDQTVVTAYSKEQLQRGVDHVRSGGAGLETDKGIATTAALLPEGSQWVAYVNPQGLLQWIGVFIEAFAGNQFQLPAFPDSDPIGLAAKVSESGLDAELVLPDTVVAGLGVFVGAAAQIFQGGGLPLP